MRRGLRTVANSVAWPADRRLRSRPWPTRSSTTRLAELYDPLDPDRSDLEVYAAIVDELGARSVLDVGCGTGTFACLLAERGLEVTGVDPAGASLDVARTKPGAERVPWVHGDATALPPLQVDLATMTANVAQVFVTDEDWARDVARGARRAPSRRPPGLRDPRARAPGLGASGTGRTPTRAPRSRRGGVETWCDLLDVTGDLVSFRWTFAFDADGAVLTSDSTLRFRHRGELEASLAEAGFVVVEVRDAPDRPGREWVYVARRA